MDLGEAAALAIGGGGLVKVIDFAIHLIRSRRAAKDGDAKVQVAEIGADQTALRILASRVSDVEKLLVRERDDCARETRALRSDIEELRGRGEECERRSTRLESQVKAQTAELVRLRSLMRDDNTPAFGRRTRRDTE